MSGLFSDFVYKPLYNLLIFVYNVVPLHDFGLAIIVVTITIKLFLIPLSKKQIKAQKKMQELQPKIKEIQEKYKHDKEKQSRAMLEFYKTNKANPLGGCLSMIIQLIFLIAIYQVLFNISKNGLMVDGAGLYSFVENPGQINRSFLGIVDLSQTLDVKNLTSSKIPHLILIILAAASQYFQTKMLMPSSKGASQKSGGVDFTQAMSRQMLYLGPILTLFIGVSFPAGLALYWFTSTVFSIVQQRSIIKKEKKDEIKN